MGADARSRDRAVRRDVYTPATLPGARREAHLSAFAGHGGSRLAPVARLREARRILRRDRPRLRGPGQPVRFHADGLRRRPARSRCCARRGCCRFTAASRRRRSRTTSRFRSSCCRRSAADRACAASRAGGFATATACCCRPNGASSSIASSTWRVFYDTGKVTAQPGRSQSRRPEERRRPRLPVPRTALATPLRIDFAKSNEGLVDRVRLVGRLLEHRTMGRITMSLRVASALVRCCSSLCAGLRRSVSTRRRASTATIRSPASRPAATPPASSRGTSA